MSKEVNGGIGVIKGHYKKEASAPLIINSCQHAIIKKDRRIHRDILVVIHGKDNGESHITEHEIGRSQ